MSSLYGTGVRPAISDYLRKQAEKERDYGDYWSASSAGYCMRLLIMRRLGVPKVPELDEDLDRQTRVFEAGHIFHEWIQRITKNSGVSVAQELELIDDDIMVKGHFDDLIDVDGTPILYDYKTAHSASFNFKKGRPIGDYHKMQLGTYLYMVNKKRSKKVKEGRILTISKDDLRLDEKGIDWTPELKEEVEDYWQTLNKYWKNNKMPQCTCAEKDGGFMGKRSKKGKIYNDFFYNDEPCSMEWMKLTKERWHK